jgi:hypothetical protein
LIRLLHQAQFPAVRFRVSFFGFEWTSTSVSGDKSASSASSRRSHSSAPEARTALAKAQLQEDRNGHSADWTGRSVVCRQALARALGQRRLIRPPEVLLEFIDPLSASAMSGHEWTRSLIRGEIAQGAREHVRTQRSQLLQQCMRLSSKAVRSDVIDLPSTAI